jgi:hypothetical protein
VTSKLNVLGAVPLLEIARHNLGFSFLLNVYIRAGSKPHFCLCSIIPCSTAEDRGKQCTNVALRRSSLLFAFACGVWVLSVLLFALHLNKAAVALNARSGAAFGLSV